MEQEGVSIKVAGALKGAVRVASFDISAGELRAEVARLLGVSDVGSVKMIAGGRNLLDDAKPLRAYHVTASSRLLVTRGAAAHSAELAGAEAAAGAEEARTAKLERLKAAADRMAARGDGRGLTDRYEFSLENQAGTALSLSDGDRRGLVLGLALHDKGKASMEAGELQAALGELLLAEESFGLVSPSVLEGVDNLGMLLLDIVWCCYKLRDVSRLGVCSERLAQARRMLAKAHGPHQERLRLLHGGFSPEQAIYVRLELLEGVVAFHSGEAAAAAAHLAAAQARWQRLQLSPGALLALAEMGYADNAANQALTCVALSCVALSCVRMQLSPGALLALAEMGYAEQEAQRALRFSGDDLAAAVDFLTEQRQRDQARRAERGKQRDWLREREAYGKTPSGKFVDQQPLQQLLQLGYEKGLAAEALRAADNDGQAALDVLGDPVRRGALQLALIAQQMLEEEQGPQSVKASRVRRLTAMGFKEKAARIALKAAVNSIEGALEQLQAMGDDARDLAAAAAAAAVGGAAAAAGGDAGAGPSQQQAAGDGAAEAMQEDQPDAAAAAAQAAQDPAGVAREAAAPGGGRRRRRRSRRWDSSSSSDEEGVDQEMEGELVNAVRGKQGKGEDPLSAYDMDVSEDGEAIQLYLSMLASANGSSGASGSSAAAAAAGGS
uniref:UBA domain-containing protein n=1 Tax=Tetradesmus obliquus TaxID=3088 RepID=A0A383VMY7_TETOB